VRRLATLALLAGAFVAALAGPASAHALLRSSDPANGATLASSPTRVEIEFTQPVDVGLTVVHVLDQSGQPVERGGVRSAGAPTTVQVDVPDLPKGVYTVTWRTVSKTDGHVTANSFTFGVGVKPSRTPTGGPPVQTTPPPSVLAVAGRWGFYWGLALLLGFAVAGTVVWRRTPAGSRALLAGAWALAAAGLIAMTLAERSTVGVGLGTLLRSDAGRQFLDRGVALLVAGGAVAFAVARPSWTSLPPVGLAAAAAMLVHSIAGHAAESKPVWFNVGAQWLHMMSVAVWIGGLGWLLLALRAGEDPDRPRVVRRFSNTAAVALGFVAVTGLVRALDEVGGFGSWGRMFTTAYGITLVVKVALFGGLVALGWANRYRNVPAVVAARDEPARGRLRRTVVAEVLIAAGIFGATGVLSELPPSASVAQATGGRQEEARPLVVRGHDFATSVRVRLSVSPGTVGLNDFDARITDFDSGEPVDATAVSLQFALPGSPQVGTPEVPLRKARNGHWTGSGTVLSIFGRWSVTVAVQERTGGVEVPLRLTPKLPQETIQRLPAQAGQPTLYQITIPPGGVQLQTYVDPGRPGKNVVHFTFFDTRTGNELPIASATGTAVRPDGSVASLPLIRFDKGHFVSNETLPKGRWTFLIDATARNGTAISGWFRQAVG
jgi:copper transport protein